MAGTWNVDIVRPNAGNPLDLPSAPISSLRVKKIGNADYTILPSDGYDVIMSDTTLTASHTAVLPPAASSTGRILHFVKEDIGNFDFIIDTPGAETINGSASNRIRSTGGYLRLFCDGLNWYVLVASDFITAFGTATPATNVQANVTSLVIPEGTWIVSANAYNSGTATGISDFNIGFSAVTATLPGTGLFGDTRAATAATVATTLSLNGMRVVLTAATTYYLVSVSTFSGGTSSMPGRLSATRII